MGLGNFAGTRHQHREGQFGGGDGVAAGGVHDHDPAAGGGFDIDVVHSDASATDDPELGGGFHDVAGDLGLGPDDHGRDVFDDGDEFVLLEAFIEDNDLEVLALLQQVDAFGRDRITNQNFHFQRPVIMGIHPPNIN